MIIKIIETKESDGNWYKVYADDTCKACIRIDNKEEGEALERITEIFDFWVENKGESKIIKSIDV
jgi:hypothetical protein